MRNDAIDVKVNKGLLAFGAPLALGVYAAAVVDKDFHGWFFVYVFQI